MSTHIIGFRPPDEDWQLMKAVYDACEEAGIRIPDEVDIFFQGEPDENGTEIDITELKEAVKIWGDQHRDGYEVDISKLPSDITKIRFYNSW